MQKKAMFASFIKYVACAALVIGAATAVHAEDKKIDGTWKWVQPGRNGGTGNTNTLTLKAEGNKLTGNLSAPNRNGQVIETAISEGTITNNQIGFTVSREINGTKFVRKFSGKMEGDVIKGKSEFDRNGQSASRDWEAKRQ